MVKVIRLDDIADRVDVLIEHPKKLIHPAYVKDKIWIEDYYKANHFAQPPPDVTNICIRCALDNTAMLLKSIGLEAVIEGIRLFSTNGLYIINSSVAAKEKVLRIYLRNGILGGKLTLEQKIPMITSKLRSFPIRGVDGVYDSLVIETVRHEELPDGSLKAKRIFAVETVGTNMYGIMTNQDIVKEHVVPSSVKDTYAMFGIEAARSRAITETHRVLGEGAILHTHLGLIMDILTRDGYVGVAGPHGVSAREKSDILLRMANASAYKTVVEAATRGTKVKIGGIAGSMFMGNVAKCGSLYNNVIVNEEFVKQHTRSTKDILNDI
jgi:hypothetical protein